MEHVCKYSCKHGVHKAKTDKLNIDISNVDYIYCSAIKQIFVIKCEVVHSVNIAERERGREKVGEKRRVGERVREINRKHGREQRRGEKLYKESINKWLRWSIVMAMAFLQQQQSYQYVQTCANTVNIADSAFSPRVLFL